MSEDSWITESVVQFTRSPLWSTPINNFIDDNCWIFDGGEMMLRQTEVHITFRNLVDELLTNFVKELGVSLDDVLKAVENTVYESSVAQKPAEVFLSYIFYVDDFRSFHKMMSKRNVELDILASRELQRSALKKNNDSAGMKTDDPELSEDEAMHLAIAASLQDDIITRKEIEFADLQIQEALALSISAENERVRRNAEALNKTAECGSAPLAPVQVEEARKEKIVALEEEREQNIMKLEARALEVRQEALLRGITATEVVESKSVLPSSGKVPPLSKKPDAKTTPPAPVQMTNLDRAPPRVGLGKLHGLKPLPSIQPSFKQLEQTTPSTVPTENLPDPELIEMEARAKYMREQREKIVAQKKANRNRELSEYSANKGSKPKQDENCKEEKQMTVDLARRLREDIIREASK